MRRRTNFSRFSDNTRSICCALSLPNVKQYTMIGWPMKMNYFPGSNVPEGSSNVPAGQQQQLGGFQVDWSLGILSTFILSCCEFSFIPITASKCFKLKCANHWALLSCKRLSNSENLKRSRCKISSNFANFPLCLTWVLNLSPAGFFKLFPNCFIQSKWMSQHSATTDFTQKLDKMVIKYIDTLHEDIYLR